MDASGKQSIVLFDGVCNVCSASVNFIIRRDSKKHFLFAPLQSEIGKRLLREHNLDKEGIDSVILIENGQVFAHSTAALKIAAKLDGAWKMLSIFKFVPRKLRDFCYKLFAKNRYRLFGKKEVCMMPTPDIKARFLEQI